MFADLGTQLHPAQPRVFRFTRAQGVPFCLASQVHMDWIQIAYGFKDMFCLIFLSWLIPNGYPQHHKRCIYTPQEELMVLRPPTIIGSAAYQVHPHAAFVQGQVLTSAQPSPSE